MFFPPPLPLATIQLSASSQGEHTLPVSSEAFAETEAEKLKRQVSAQFNKKR